MINYVKENGTLLSSGNYLLSYSGSQSAYGVLVNADMTTISFVYTLSSTSTTLVTVTFGTKSNIATVYCTWDYKNCSITGTSEFEIDKYRNKNTTLNFNLQSNLLPNEEREMNDSTQKLFNTYVKSAINNVRVTILMDLQMDIKDIGMSNYYE